MYPLDLFLFFFMLLEEFDPAAFISSVTAHFSALKMICTETSCKKKMYISYCRESMVNISGCDTLTVTKVLICFHL